MTQTPDRGMLWASLIALSLHLVLFLAVLPMGRDILAGARIAPRTHYLARAETVLPMEGPDVRTVKSPVVFSLPTSIGFSRVLMENEVATPPGRLSRPRQSESFLEADPTNTDDGNSLIPHELILTDTGLSAPALPYDVYRSAGARPAARRVTLSPELKERLEGGLVLPQGLNREVETAWEARASVSVSADGFVDHVFLDKPVEPAALNEQVLQLLYGLHFKPGEKVAGGIAIYSPEATAKQEDEK